MTRYRSSALNQKCLRRETFRSDFGLGRNDVIINGERTHWDWIQNGLVTKLDKLELDNFRNNK